MEYDDIYETGEWGFKFISKNGRIGKSRAMSKDEFESAPAIAMNEDCIVVFCSDCDTYMHYNGIGLIQEDYYICPKCGRKIKEKTPYKHLEKENEDFIGDLNLSLFEEEDDDHYYDYDDIF